MPLHTALHRLVKAKEASWREPSESNRQAHQEGVMTMSKTRVLAGLLATLAAIAARRRDRVCGDEADRDRLGLSTAREHGPVRRAGARRREGRRSKKINAAGGVNGRQLRILTCDTQNNNPAKTRSRAPRSLIGKGADIGWVTCDVDYATPVVQEAINRGHARGRAVHRHRPDGTEALRGEGRARVQLRQRRPGRGLGDGGVRVERGWKSAALVTNTLLVYFKNVVQAFEESFKQLGGTVVEQETYARREQRQRGGHAV